MAPTILLTRPAAQSARFAKMFRDRIGPARVIVAPLIEVQFLNASLPEGHRGLIFTSEQGVHAYCRIAPQRDLPAWCVGGRTAEVAAAAGFDARSAEGDARALIDLVIAANPAGPLLHARGRHSRGEVAQSLSSAGIETAEVVLYEQHAVPIGQEARSALGGTDAVFVPLFSPRSARLFAEAAAGASAPLHILALSPAVAQEVAGLETASVCVAAKPDAGSLAEALATQFAAVRPA